MAGPGQLFWVVVFDRGRVSAPRGFAVREEAVVFATLQMADADVAPAIDWNEARARQAAVDRGALGG